MPNLPTGRSKQFIVKPSAHGLVQIRRQKMATKTGKAQSTSIEDAMLLIYAVDQTQAILNMIKDVK
jgi:hypothetical protein